MDDHNLRDWWAELFQIHEFAQYQSYANALTVHEVDFIIEALSLRGVETILDLACGGGRHALELSRRGFSLEGLDAADSVIRHARSRAAAADLNTRFVVGDMRELNYQAVFDAVLIMNSSIGFFDETGNQAVLAGAAQALAPGGRLLLQCINPYQIESFLHNFRNGWYQVGAGYVLRQSSFDPISATLSIDYRYVDSGQGLDLAHPGDRIRLYAFPELRKLIESAGLRPQSVFGDAVLPPRPFDEQSQWQVIVAIKDQPLTVDPSTEPA